jgi:hypothetical protein
MSKEQLIERASALLGHEAVEVDVLDGLYDDHTRQRPVNLVVEVHSLTAKVLDEILQLVRFYGVVSLDKVFLRGATTGTSYPVRVIVKFYPHDLDWRYDSNY